MLKFLSILSLFLLLYCPVKSSAQVITNFRFQDEYPDRSGLVGNGITDLLWKDSTLYVGTGFGLSTTADSGQSWHNFTSDDYGGQGGISAMAVGPEGTVWIATAYDTTVEDDQNLSIGGGLRYRDPDSLKWIFIPQPVDALSDTAGGKQPTTTRVQNVTFDIALRSAEEIWISSFGGGVRRSLDRGETWEVITTDGLPFGALANLNHRGFSVMVDSSSHIWVGTVGGISRSTDGGETWDRFTATNQNEAISGNWVIGLWHNPYDNSVWATTLRSVEDNEFNAISATRNGGLSWEIFLAEELSDGTFPRYIAFFDSAVYVATEKGVYKSIDGGESWFLFPRIRDRVSGEGLFTTTFFSAATSPGSPDHRLWVGSADGLASTANSGFDWTVFRGFISTRERREPAVYAYPNPFSPLHSDRPCRFQFDISAATEVIIDIYNFAMERVITLGGQQSAPEQGTFDRSLTWDGKDNNGRLVDNGIYFFRANVGGEISWGKIAVIN